MVVVSQQIIKGLMECAHSRRDEVGASTTSSHVESTGIIDILTVARLNGMSIVNTSEDDTVL